jgi:hypothetical protein
MITKCFKIKILFRINNILSWESAIGILGQGKPAAFLLEAEPLLC